MDPEEERLRTQLAVRQWFVEKFSKRPLGEGMTPMEGVTEAEAIEAMRQRLLPKSSQIELWERQFNGD